MQQSSYVLVLQTSKPKELHPGQSSEGNLQMLEKVLDSMNSEVRTVIHCSKGGGGDRRGTGDYYESDCVSIDVG